MKGYNLHGNPDEQFELLRKAECIINAQSTFPLPDEFKDYKQIIDLVYDSFYSLLKKLKSLRTSERLKTTDFFTDCEIPIKNIGKYDVISFDSDNTRNNLKSEKLKLLLLKEDIVTALENAKAFIVDKISKGNTFISESSATIINADKIASLQMAAKKILGEEALMLPHFKLSEDQGTEFLNSYENADKLHKFLKEEININDRRIFPVEDWLSGVSRVREKVHHWENICILSNAFKSDNVLDLCPLQFPYMENDRWLAMKFRDEKLINEKGESIDNFKINTDKLLYTAHFAKPFEKVKPQCGVIIDEWTEVIPSKEETTGIAFNYNQPNSEPPQTMLLVVPPEITGSWNWEHVIESLEETMEMAKKRAIEPQQIETSNYAQFLPTTMMAVTSHFITVATNLSFNTNLNLDKN